MIRVRRMNGETIVLNAELIQSVENTPDTLITLVNGTKILVQDTMEEVVAKFMSYKRELAGGKL